MCNLVTRVISSRSITTLCKRPVLAADLYRCHSPAFHSPTKLGHLKAVKIGDPSPSRLAALNRRVLSQTFLLSIFLQSYTVNIVTTSIWITQHIIAIIEG